MSILVLGSRQASLQERGVKFTTRRGEEESGKRPWGSRLPGYGRGMCCWLHSSSHLQRRASRLGLAFFPQAPPPVPEPHWETKSQGIHITYLDECPKPVSVKPLSSLASPNPTAASPLATERGLEPMSQTVKPSRLPRPAPPGLQLRHSRDAGPPVPGSGHALPGWAAAPPADAWWA